MEIVDAKILSERPHRTRAEVIRDSVKIRLALDETGPLIAEVLAENGIELPDADWSKIFPHWLIATVNDDVVGCCQVLASKPVGYVEFLFVKPSAPFKIRAIAIRKLIIQSMATIQMNGSSYLGAILDAKNEKFRNVLEKLNFVKSANNIMMAKRLIV